MSADKHPAEVLADKQERLEFDEPHSTADMLRTIPALEAERDNALQAARYESDLAQQAIEDMRAAQAERDQLRTEVGRLQECVGLLTERSDRENAERDQLRAEVEALRADAERMEWLCFAPALMVSANMPDMREWLMKRPAGLNNLRDAIDEARTQQ